jgi:hypothetical protein
MFFACSLRRSVGMFFATYLTCSLRRSVDVHRFTYSLRRSTEDTYTHTLLTAYHYVYVASTTVVSRRSVARTGLCTTPRD